jgi:hypothetical protein
MFAKELQKIRFQLIGAAKLTQLISIERFIHLQTVYMKNIFSCLLIVVATGATAQPLRIHLMGGFANYTGDLQQKRFTLKQAIGVVTAGATFNLTEKFALRSEYSFAKIGADDKKASDPSLRKRNLNFNTLIQEFNVMGEFDILNLNDHKITPYVFAGVGVFKFSPYTQDSAGRKIHLWGLHTEGQETSEYPTREQYKRLQLNIPVGGGIKYAISDDVHLAFELAYRKLFTDYLDDVSTTYADPNILFTERGATAVQYAFRGDELKTDPQPYPAAGTPRGSAKYKDSYYFGQVRISFRMNWFDNGFYSSRNKNKLGCPTRL